MELICPSSSSYSCPILAVRTVFISSNWWLWFFIYKSKSFLIEPSYDSIWLDKNYLTSDYYFVISLIKVDLVSDKSFFYPSILSFRIASTSFIFLPSYSFNSSFAYTYWDDSYFLRVDSKSASSFWAPSCLSFIDDFISSFCFDRF